MEKSSSEIQTVYEDIKSMRVRGALNIAVTAAKALRKQLNEMDSVDVSSLKKSGDRLKEARPTAVSLPNAIDYVIHLSEKEGSREKALEQVDSFIENLESSLENIAEIGSRVIEDGDVILTHCNSSTAVKILQKAWADGKRFEVFSTETRPRFQGHITCKQLLERDIPVTMTVDSAAFLTMQKKNVNKVLVGADTVCANGDVLNKIGTAQLAIAAKKMGVDFLVAVESIKFSPQSLMGRIIEIEERNPDEVWSKEDGRPDGLQIFNPAFDITDSEYVDMIITELGIMPPGAVYQMVREKFSWELAPFKK